MDLLRASEVAPRQIKILGHGAELDIVSAQDVPELSQRLLWTHVGTGVARAIVAGEEQFELLPRTPAFSFAEYPGSFCALDISADQGFEDKVHHAAEPPIFSGHSREGYVKFASPLKLSN